MLPGLYALAAVAANNPGFYPHLFVRAGILYLIDVVWAVSVYLFAACLGVWACNATSATHSRSYLAGAATLLVMFPAVLATNHWISRGIPATVLTYGPILAGAGLILVVLFYQAGWRLFGSLDL